MDRVLRRWAAVVGVALFVAAAWIAAALSSLNVTNQSVPVLDNSPPAAPSATSVSMGAPSAPPDSGAGGWAVPGWLTTLAGVLCTVVAVSVLGTLVWYLVRDRLGRRSAPLITRRGAARPLAARTDVVAAVEAGLSDLSDTDADPRRAIIACWVRLEQAAAAAGTSRRPSDSSTDLVVRLLNTQRVSATVLDGFASVYREARFTTHPVDERMRHAAVTALQQLRAELATAQAPVGIAGGGR